MKGCGRMDRMENSKDRLVGTVKESAGKILDLEELEFKGKLQKIKSEVGDKMEDIKDEVYGKANELLDKVRGNDRNNS